MKLYNTLTRQKDTFEPLEPGKVRMYVCGVTVYDMCHIGHARFLVAFDVIYRTLRHLGYQVTYVRNFTDVDDKIIKRANERGVSCQALTEQFIAEFYRDVDALACLRPDVEPRVTGYMPQIVALIEQIVANGHAYVSEGDVYFDIDSFPAYGRLSGRVLEDMRAGASERTGEEEARKRNPMDFALWKASKPGEPMWDSPWGNGRPGWHIECSAMSVTNLGAPFDIHGGGKDLVFPHHENELAQSEAGYRKEFARYWMHNGFVNVDNEKMSKSLGNFFTIRDVLERYHPQVVRTFLLSTHYRSPINFSDKALDEATRRVMYVYETLEKLDRVLAEEAALGDGTTREPELPDLVKGLLPAFHEAMTDDFNTPKALAALADVMRFANELADRGKKKAPHKAPTLRAIRDRIATIAEVLGVFHLDPATVLAEIQAQLVGRLGVPQEAVEERVAARVAARVAKDWAGADAIRAELAALGVEVMDTPSGTCWKVLPRCEAAEDDAAGAP
ncbi:MAG: cysteine--tRNA ligase [Myxococcales bacterium]